jgi:GNAT superfamily N-acetyltransferase
MLADFTIRPAVAADESVLWQMLFYAAHMHDEPGKTVTDAQQNPALAIYAQDWGRAGDMGSIAVCEGRAVGAAWLRLFPANAKAYSKTDDTTPELAIAVQPDFTGQGIGTALMQNLLTMAKSRYQVVALNVRADNPAVRLYQRLGFEIVGTMTNRAGTESYDMRLKL